METTPGATEATVVASPHDDRCLTDTELDAARQLIQLSESSGGVGDSAEDMVSCSLSASSSPRSISTRAPPTAAEAEEEDVDAGPWRPEKRYRLISDVYAATAPVGAGGRGHPKKRPGAGWRRSPSRREEGERRIERVA